jgi:cysteine desulfurase
VGGTQELGRRGGTENVPGIAGAAAAAREARAWLEDGRAREALARLRDGFERAIVEGVNARLPAGWPRCRVNGAGAASRLWNTTNIAFPRLEAEAILLALSERGVHASAGAACSSGSLDPSPVLLAMGVEPELAHGSIRFSMSRETTEAELAEAVRITIACVERLLGAMP